MSGVIELGWVVAGDLDGALQLAVWVLDPGEWSEPTRARGGVHIAQVIERRESNIPAFKDVEDEIRGREERARGQRADEGLPGGAREEVLPLSRSTTARRRFPRREGETTTGVEFPFVVPGHHGRHEERQGQGRLQGAEAEAEGAEEQEIERGLEEIEENAPPESDAPEELAPPTSPAGLPADRPAPVPAAPAVHLLARPRIRSG